MKTKKRTFIRLVTMIVPLLLSGVVAVSVAQAQDPRPPVDSGGNGDSSGGPTGSTGGGRSSSSANLNCASLSGQVLNWGFGPQEGIGIELKTGSWQVATASASDGNYGLGGLGVGIAELNMSVAPELADQLHPLVENAGVYLACDFPIIVNLAVSGSQIEPPATIEILAPTDLQMGSNVPLKLTVKNGLPNEITNVIVTDLMPSGLIPLEVKAAAVDESNARIIDGGDDGQLVVVYLDKLEAEAETNIFITVTVAEEVPANTQVTNFATLFYRESVAAQDSLELNLSGNPLAIPAAMVALGEEEIPEEVDTTASALPEAETAAITDEAFVPPEKTPAVEDKAISVAGETETETDSIPPEGMPTTGGELISTKNEVARDDTAPIIDEPHRLSKQPQPMQTDLDESAVNDTTGANLDQNTGSTPSPVTYISAVLLLIVLIGLASRNFSARLTRSAYENKE
jgi:uncharacterized repeat protein (TIGR01451 family)